jgi:hypothetical protein
MKKKPIGVWFSVALVIFALGLGAGSYIGTRAARYWYRHKQQEQIAFSGPERAQLESVLSELRSIQDLEVFSAISATEKQLGKKYILDDIRVFERIEQKSDLPEIKPVIDFDLGRAYVYLALAEEQTNNGEQAARYMKSAQTLFQSLGWSDYTEVTLKNMARRKLDRWSAPTKTPGSGQ